MTLYLHLRQIGDQEVTSPLYWKSLRLYTALKLPVQPDLGAPAEPRTIPLLSDPIRVEQKSIPSQKRQMPLETNDESFESVNEGPAAVGRWG